MKKLDFSLKYSPVITTKYAPFPLLFPVSNGDSPVVTTFPRSNYRGFLTTGESYCTMYTLCNDANHKEEEMEGQEGMLQLVDQRDTVVGFPNCLGKGQSLWNLTRERQLRGGRGVMREGLDEKEEDMEEDMENEEDTFQLIDKSVKTLIQPRQLCQHK